MDEAIIKYYRGLLGTQFEHAGSLENPSIFIDTVGKNVSLCGNSGDFMQIYIKVDNNVIEDIKYTCACNPTTNVAVEILCALVKGKPLYEASIMKEQEFYSYLGTESEEFVKSVRGLLELVRNGIHNYERKVS